MNIECEEEIIHLTDADIASVAGIVCDVVRHARPQFLLKHGPDQMSLVSLHKNLLDNIVQAKERAARLSADPTCEEKWHFELPDHQAIVDSTNRDMEGNRFSDEPEENEDVSGGNFQSTIDARIPVYYTMPDGVQTDVSAACWLGSHKIGPVHAKTRKGAELALKALIDKWITPF